jgi:4-hydroxybenzoate polyprenyltransferase
VNTKTHTDIKQEGWVIRHLPPVLRPYAVLARLDRPVGTWLLLLPGWWSIMLASGGVTHMDGRAWKIFTLFGIGAIVMRSAGCVINDLWDRDFDRRVERTQLRPLASGAIGVKQACGFLFFMLFIGLMILLQMNMLTILLGFISLPFIIIYPLMKRFTWWPQAFLGLTFNFGALMGWSAVTGEIGHSAQLLYVAGILWTLGYDTIYAHQDVEDDALVGIKSTARRFGAQSKKYVTGFYAAALGLMAAAAGPIHGIFLIPAAAYVFWILSKWNPDDTGSSLRAFRANRNFALLILAAVAF